MRKKMNLNDFSKWLQYNGVKNVRGSEYFPYTLYVGWFEILDNSYKGWLSLLLDIVFRYNMYNEVACFFIMTE